MNILAIDTSNNSGSIALQINKEIRFSCFFNIKITHSETLMPEIARALSFCNLKVSDLNAIAIAIGPGSFTGLRIGLASAKGLALANKIPIIAISSLKVQAMNFYKCSRDILVVQDARMKELYVAKYDQYLNEVIPAKCIKPIELSEYADNKTIICGTAVSTYKDTFNKIANAEINELAEKNSPRAESMFSIIEIEHINPAFDFDEISKLEPYYIRKSQAEINYRL